MRTPTQDIRLLVSGLNDFSLELGKARHGQGEGTRLSILRLAAAGDDVHPSDIAGELELSLSSVTRQIHTLAGNGLVKLTEDPRDRRSFVVTVTATGQEEITRLTQLACERFAVFVRDWDPADTQTLGRLLTRLAESIKATSAQGKRGPAGRSWQGSS